MSVDLISTVTCSYCRQDVAKQPYCESCGAPLELNTTNPLGQRIGDYLLEKTLAEGGNGRLYCARHISTSQRVALKLLHPRLANNPKSIRRLRREAEIGIRLQHPHAVKLFEFGIDSEFGIYLVMELIDGPTLYQVLLDEHRLEPMRALSIALQTCEVLDKAHYLEVVHRDLKPSNIMLKRHPSIRDYVKVCDFGLAKLETQNNMETKLTVPGTIHGTPGYMSPEQCKGSETDYRTDIYTMGIILYQMLTGKLPYYGENPLVILKQQLFQPPAPLQQAAPHLQKFESIQLLEQIILRCMDKEPSKRYPNIEALRHELALALPSYTPLEIMLEAEQGIDPGPPNPPPPMFIPHRSISLRASQRKELQRVLREAPLQTALPDQTLFQEEESPTCFYLIAEGEVRLIQQDKHYIVEVDRLGSGDFLGVSAFFSRSPHATTAAAIEQTKLHRVDDALLAQWLQAMPSHQQLFHALYHEDTLQRMLRYAKFFASLPESSRYELLTQSTLKSFGANEVVVHAQQRLDQLYIIVSGSVAEQSHPNDPSRSSIFGMGETFGEVQVLSHQPTTATYITQKNTVLLGIPIPTLQEYMALFPYVRQFLEARAQSALSAKMSLNAEFQKTYVDYL